MVRYFSNWRRFLGVSALALTLAAAPMPAIVRQDSMEIGIAYTSRAHAQAASSTTGTNPSGDQGLVSSGLEQLMEWVSQLFAGFVYFGGVALNASAYYSIVKMGEFVGGQSALQAAWATFRDIGNIVLLFGFVAIGFQTILQADTHHTRQRLVLLVIVAMTINFSSLVARGVIDVGNITAFQFYKAFNGGAAPSGSDFTDHGIADKFVAATKAQTTLAHTVPGTGLGTVSITYFLSIILYVIVAFVLFSLAFLFISRFVILTFLIVISPLAFAALVLPRFGSQAKKWWDTLLGNTFVAPITMLLLLISMKLVESPAFVSATGGSGTNLGDYTSASWANSFLAFAIITGFFVASLLIAKQLSAFGANWAVNAGGRITAAPFVPATRFAGRVGAKGAKRWDQFVGSRGSAARSILIGSGIDSAVKSALKAPQTAKVGGFRSYDEYKKATDARVKETKHAAHEAHQQEELAEAIKTNDPDKLQQFLQKMSVHDLEQTGYMKKAANGIEVLAKNLSPDKFEKLLDSKDVSDEAKEKLKEARLRKIDAANVKGQTNKDLELMARYEPEQFAKLIEASDAQTGKSIFTDDQLETLGKNDKLTQSQRARAKANGITGRIETAVKNNDATAVALLLKNVSSKQKGRLNAEAAKNDMVVSTYTQADLGALMSEGNLNAADRKEIITKLQQAFAADPDNERLKDIEYYFQKNPSMAGQWGWKVKTPTPSAQEAGRTDFQQAAQQRMQGRANQAR
jgi:hypothetical protein